MENKIEEAIKFVEHQLDKIAHYANEYASKQDKEINALYSGKTGAYREILTFLTYLQNSK